MVKEAYFHGKRGLFSWRKRPIFMAKEAYFQSKRPSTGMTNSAVCVNVERDLYSWQKRPIFMAKEAYFHGKRGLFSW